MTERTAEIERLLAACTVEERRAIFNLLRREFPIHTIEATLNIEAEIILDAISRSDDLTLRGVRGVIAQAAFALDVIGGLREWHDITQGENLPYDFLLTSQTGTATCVCR